MDNLDKLKCQIIAAYSNMLQRLQVGYPFEDYCTIKEAMLAVNYIEEYTLAPYKVQLLIDRYTLLLMKL